MTNDFQLTIDGWLDGAPIPPKYAFGQPGEEAPFEFGGNLSPAIRWCNPPTGTCSYALLCIDRDAPHTGEDVNQPDRVIPATLERVDFYHWVLIDIPTHRTSIAEGTSAVGITPHGKPTGNMETGIEGRNSYTEWFATDPEMQGTYGGYDGPCPPWNDSIPHRYTFQIYALACDSLGLEGAFSGEDVIRKMAGHILGSAKYEGKYSMNPEVRA